MHRDMIPNPITVDLSSIWTDPESLSLTITIKDNTTDITSLSYIEFDPLTHKLKFTPTENAHGGDHSMTVKITDGISIPLEVTFLVRVDFNMPLVALGTIDDLKVIVGNAINIPLDAEALFEDPEGLPWNYYYRLKGTEFRPQFWRTDYIEKKIWGMTSIADINEYKMELVGVDNANQETIIPFTFFV